MTSQDDEYLMQNGISATEMMKTAINYHKKGVITLSVDIFEIEQKLKRFQTICEKQTIALHELQEKLGKYENGV